MAKPFQLQGSNYSILGIQMRGRVEESNGVIRDLLLGFDYGPETPCENTPNSVGQKRSLVTTATTGFQAKVATPLVSTCFNKGWINNGIYSRWKDTVTDPWEQVGLTGAGVRPATSGAGLTVDITAVAGVVTAAVLAAVGAAYPASSYVTVVVSTGGVNAIIGGMTDAAGTFTGATFTVVNGGTGYATAAGVATQQPSGYDNPTGDGGIGTLTSRLPLDNNVTVRKFTAVRGKNWKGNWRPSCVDKTFATDDELNAVGQAAWNLLKAGLYGSISDGESTLVPILISVTESQMVRNPTTIRYANLVLPGVNAVTGEVNTVIDLALGSSRRRKERKTVTF